MSAPLPTCGRLAPTPSGLLHLGNAASFLLAWLWARAEGGRVILRVEDIDGPRCTPVLREQAIRDLAALGLDWDDGPEAGSALGPFDQSSRTEIYRRHLDRLTAAGLAYPCVCSRKDIQEAAGAPHGEEGPIYPGVCRDRFGSVEEARRLTGVEPAVRFRWEGTETRFCDHLRGEVVVDGPRELGDFVLWRRDGLPSYQLAVAVDDALMGVTQVLRGRDLLTSTPRQLALYAALGLMPPGDWAHISLLQEEGGRRLAKRNGDLSLRALLGDGVRPERIVGLAACASGLTGRLEEISARELVPAFAPSRLRREDFALTAEHLKWLRGGT